MWFTLWSWISSENTIGIRLRLRLGLGLAQAAFYWTRRVAFALLWDVSGCDKSSVCPCWEWECSVWRQSLWQKGRRLSWRRHLKMQRFKLEATRMDKIRHEDSRGTAQAKQFGDKAREVTKAWLKSMLDMKVADDLLWWSQKKKIRRRNEVKPNTRPSPKRRLYFKYMMHLLRRWKSSLCAMMAPHFNRLWDHVMSYSQSF